MGEMGKGKRGKEEGLLPPSGGARLRPQFIDYESDCDYDKNDAKSDQPRRTLVVVRLLGAAAVFGTLVVVLLGFGHG